MNRKKSILISLTGITVVMLALLGLTYGYYITNIIGNTNSNSISIDTKDLKLVYNDGTEDLVFGAIEPGWTNSDEPKVFTVNNTGKSNIDEYAVGIDEVINTLNRTEDLVYTITCKSYKFDDYEADGDEAEENGVCRGNSGEFPKENSLILTNQIDSGYIHVYEMVISYKYLDDVNQSEDMGASVGGRIQIYTLPDTIDITGTVTGYSEGDYVEISTPTKTSQIVDGKYKLIGVEPGNHTLSIKYLDENDVVQTRSSKQISVRMGEDAGVSDNTITMNSTSGNVTINLNASSSSLGTDITGVGEHTKLLKDVIIANAIKNTNTNSTTGTIYSPTPLTIPGQTVSGENERTLSIAEDDYGSSYYFRGNVIDNYVNFSGMCWRVLRVQGNGIIKLILADQNNECNSDGYSVNNARTSILTDISYGTSSIIYTDTLIPTFLNNWKSSLDVTKMVETDWCNDTSIYRYTYYSDYGSTVVDGSDMSIVKLVDKGFGAEDRIINGNPTLKCDMIGLDGSYAIKVKDNIALITADEALFAGYSKNFSEYKGYLLNNMPYEVWTMSPGYDAYNSDGSNFEKGPVYYMAYWDEERGVLLDSGLGSGAPPTAGLRPVISLNSEVVTSYLENSEYLPGTYQNPYVIE